jgi:CubicO group peptidase (beta-lactamase class C family)
MRTLAHTALLAGAVALVASTLGATASAQVAPPRDAKNASYWDRIDHPQADPLHPPLDSYKPLVKIGGASGGAFLPIAAPGKTTIPAQALEEASQFAEANQSQALIIVHKGVVQLERYYGGADANQQFSSHSFAKTLDALAIGAAIAEGRIKSIDEPASRWLPEWRDGQRDAITLRQLLTMSGGFQSAPSSDPASHYLQLHYGADVEAIVRDAPLAYPPGTKFAFDNDNLHPLGLVIERATQMPYADWVATRIWKKAGASDASMLLDREGGRAMSFCCMLAKPRDWIWIGQMFLHDGMGRGQRVVPASWIAAMREPAATNPNYGLQLFLGAAWMDPRINYYATAQKDSLRPAADPDLYYLSGAGGQVLMIVPSEELIILRAGKGSPGWRDQAIPNLLHAALAKDRQSAKVDWSWIYDWRLANKFPPFPWLYDPTSTHYWPTERVASKPAAPLPRKIDRCLTEAAIAPAMDELTRVKSYGFLVWHDGAIEVEHYWPGYGPDTRAESASMHKSVLGLVVGQAIADGRIDSLDTPISRWLTEWAGDPRGAITLRQMMQMTSGLEALPFDMSKGSKASVTQLGGDIEPELLTLKLTDPPGTTFAYGSTVSQLIGVIVQRATGERYADYLSRRLWQPLGAADAYVSLDHPGGLAKTSGTLLARPEDWVRLGLLFIDDGRVGTKQVVDAAWLDAMTTASPQNPNYGMQIWRANPYNANRKYNKANAGGVPARAPFLADDMVFFDGAGAQRVYISKKEHLVIVRLGDSVYDWDDSLVPNVVTAAARTCSAQH